MVTARLLFEFPNILISYFRQIDEVDLKKLTSNSIAFSVAPLLNGATRMDKIKHAIDILLSDDPKECRQLAKEIIRINDERREKETLLINELIPQVNLNDKIIITTTESISTSFNGLLASKLSQEYQRPAIVLRKNKNNLNGSYRGYGDFKLREFLNRINFIEYAEGHEFAGGIGLKENKLNELKRLINEELHNVIYEVVLEYDFELDAEEVTQNLIKQVEKFNRIAGKDFPLIKFLVKNIKVVNRNVIGKNNDTIKIECENGLVLMKFRVDESWGEDIYPDATLDVVGQINLNEFYHGGLKKFIRTNQIFIDDYRMDIK
jgi:single-stranded-DNA-specific exonuclease